MGDSSRLLYGVAGALAVAGVILRASPAPLPRGVAPAAGDTTVAPPAEPAQAAALLAFEEIVRSNAFSPDRRAPRARYVPPGGGLETAPVRQGPDVRLLGIATGAMGAVALIDADPAFPGAENYRVGDQVGDARLVAIDDSSITLEGSRGQRVLKLPSAGRRLP